MFVNPSVLLFRESLMIQGAAVAVFLGMVGIVESVALRRLFSNGG
jgi:hypothetical protein